MHIGYDTSPFRLSGFRPAQGQQVSEIGESKAQFAVLLAVAAAKHRAQACRRHDSRREFRWRLRFPLLDQAALDRMAAAANRADGSARQINSYFSAGGSLLSGLGSAYSRSSRDPLGAPV